MDPDRPFIKMHARWVVAKKLAGFRYLMDVIPLDAGFTRIAAWLRNLGRPLTSLCACELRSPAQFTEDGFRAFNLRYAETLRTWGLMHGDANPVARSNVCPPIAPPREPSFYAFCYAAPAPGATPT